MQIAFAARGGLSPQGKPRVWLTGHPDEIGQYREEIAADLLRAQNCAVYYDETPNAPCEEAELFAQLEQMQLVVLAVTGRFLYEPNRARETELPFALAHHIPVLPLLQEPGLEADFNARCGDLQLLTRHDPDPTALPYSEKLAKFLASVLVGDDLAARVRAAFDAYVFLSYRKKDRAAAQRLMRLIHQNEFCRDLAIWYDEFLTPGESFNEAIADALRRCKVFALAVTPHIVEPGNYVMALEYPAARQEGKPVLPVELEPTDHAALNGAFDRLPPCTDAGDARGLSDALLAALQREAVRENDDDPAHCFLIGLAYLGGIDVEVDRERGRKLIVGAAQDGLPEAMEQLARMCREGDGVPRHLPAAVYWQQQYAGAMEADFAKSGAEQEALALARALGVLARYQQEAAALGDAEKTYLRLIGHCAALEEGLDPNGPLAEAWADGCRALAELCLRQQLPGRARPQLEQALALTRRRADSAAAGLRTAQLCERMGALCRAEADAPAARGWLERSITLLQTLTAAPDTDTDPARRALAAARRALGELLAQEGDLTAARQQYEQVMALTGRWYGPNANQQEVFALSLRLGELALRRQRLGEALLDLGGALRAARALYQNQPTLAARRALRDAYAALTRGYLETGALSRAAEACQRGQTHAGKLQQETVDYRDIRGLAVSEGLSGRMCAAKGEQAEALEHCLRSTALLDDLHRQLDTAQTKQELAESYTALYRAYRRTGQEGPAWNCLARQHALLQELWQQSPDAGPRMALADCRVRLGDHYKAGKKYDTARVCYEESLALMEQLWQETGAPEARYRMAVAFARLAALPAEEPAAGRELLQKSCDLYTELCERYPEDGEYPRQLAAVCWRLGSRCLKGGEAGAAEGYFEQSIRLRQNLDLHPEDGAALAGDCASLADYTQNAGRKEEAERLYRQMAETAKATLEQEACKDWPGVRREMLRLLCGGYLQLGAFETTQKAAMSDYWTAARYGVQLGGAMENLDQTRVFVAYLNAALLHWEGRFKKFLAGEACKLIGALDEDHALLPDYPALREKALALREEWKDEPDLPMGRTDGGKA